MLLYRGVVPRLYFVEMVRWWCYIVWQRVCDIMQKYTVKNKKSSHGVFYVLLNAKNNETTIESFPYRFAVDMNLGDCVRSLGHGDFVRAWTTGDKLFLPLEPVVDWRLRYYVHNNFDCIDGLYFRYALARALAARKIMPSLSTTRNLAMFLQWPIEKSR